MVARPAKKQQEETVHLREGAGDCVDRAGMPTR